MCRAVLSVVLLVAGASTIADQTAKPPSRAAQLKEWLAAVNRHQARTLGAAAVEIAAWPDARLTGVVADVRELARFLARAHERFRRTGQESTFAYDGGAVSMSEVQQLLGLTDVEARSGDVSRLAARGALLHTDVAVALDALDPLGRAAAGSATPTALLIRDGRGQGTLDRGPHWQVARSLLDLTPADSPRLAAVRQWYVATSAYMQSRSLLSDLLPHLVRARERYPADADILFFTGAMNEVLGSPLVQEAIAGVSLPPGSKLDVSGARTHLQEARTFLRRALEHRPDHVETRVRLGRVLGALGAHAEAADHLQRALSSATSPLNQYYAALFLGGELSRLGRLDAARDAYERAAALYPRAQSPPLGLSSVARAAGNQAAAAGVLLDALGVSRQGAASQDPWWTYLAGAKDEADRALERWRGTVEHIR
jgi:tetratricopeptide (TPR) repeat protein